MSIEKRGRYLLPGVKYLVKPALVKRSKRTLCFTRFLALEHTARTVDEELRSSQALD